MTCVQLPPLGPVVAVPGVVVHPVEGHSTGLFRSYSDSGVLVSALDSDKSGVAQGA